MEYKGYVGSCEYSSVDNVYHGKLLNIGKDLVTYESNTIDGLVENFRQSVDEYIEMRENLKLKKCKDVYIVNQIIDDKESLRQKYVEMWNWLADNPEMGKIEYFQENGIINCNRPRFLCYACEYVVRYGDDTLSCYFCPIKKWGRKSYNCMDYDSIYTKYRNAKSFEEKSNYARRISKLWKKENK